MDQNYLTDLKQRSWKPGATKVLMSPSAINLRFTTHTYSRSLATGYADLHVVDGCTPAGCNYNTTYYASLTQDCANFVSQSLYAGMGFTPPNTGGMVAFANRTPSDWYYDYPTKTGSSPWVGSPALYNFLPRSTNLIGPYGVSADFATSVLSGDLVFITQSQTRDHVGMIISKGVDYSHTTLDAHTNDRRHYPLSNWATFSPAFVHILWWQN